MHEPAPSRAIALACWALSLASVVCEDEQCTVTTIAGGRRRGYVDGSGTSARFADPSGVAYAADVSTPHHDAEAGAYLFVADSENHRIRAVRLATGEVRTLAGSGAGGAADGAAEVAEFAFPSDVAAAVNVPSRRRPFLLVADHDNHNIRRVTLQDGRVGTFVGGGLGDADGIGSGAEFSGPMGVTVDPTGTYAYVADRGNHNIRKINLETTAVTTLAGVSAAGSDDGAAGVARFQYLADIAVSGAFLYVADRGNHAVRRVDLLTGDTTTFAGQHGTTGRADGLGDAARFEHPFGVAARPGISHIAVVDEYSHNLRSIDLLDGMTATIAGGRDWAGGAHDGVGSAANFFFPGGADAADAATLFVADTGNSAIRRVHCAVPTAADGEL